MFSLQLNKFKNISISAAGAKKNLSAIFLGLLLLLFFYELWVIKDVMLLVTSADKTPALPVPNSSVRINFTDYNAAVKRIQAADNFQVTDWVQGNPFGAK
jgi:hypothetical protein